LVDKFIEIYAMIVGDRKFGYKKVDGPRLTAERKVPKTVG
jgi:hypothetical protein